MRRNLMFVSAFLLLAAMLSACSSLAPASVQPPVRSLTISGAGQTTLTPDIAYLYMGVHTENASAAEAVAENNASTQKLLDALKAAGVAEADLRTTNFSIWQNQKYDPQTNQPGTMVYAVDNTVYVTARDLKNLGKLLDTAVRAGANNVNSIQFDVADKSKPLSDARNAAVLSAQKEAQELAAAAGVSLGDIQTIQYYDSAPSPAFDTKGMGGGGAAVQSAVPITPGTMQLTVTVTLVYEIK